MGTPATTRVPARPRGACRLGDARNHVVTDRALVRHPQDGSIGALACDPEHRRPQRGDEHRHLERIRDIDRTLHAVVVVVDRHGAGTGERRVEHVEVVTDEARRSLVGQPELIGDDPVVRRADAESEPAGARDLGGQRLLRKDHRVTGLDGNDGGSDLDALGDLTEQRRRPSSRRDSREPAGIQNDEKPCSSAVFPSASNPLSRSARERSLSEPIIKPIRIQTPYGT